MKYAWIDKHRQDYSTTLMCELLAVSRSGLNAARVRVPSKRAQDDERLLAQVRQAQRRHRGRYGRRRMATEVSQTNGRAVNEKRVARVMREHGLQSHKRRRFRVVTTDSKHAYPVAPNVLERDFEATAPNQKRLADTRRLAVSGLGAGPVRAQAGGLGDERDDAARADARRARHGARLARSRRGPGSSLGPRFATWVQGVVASPVT